MPYYLQQVALFNLWQDIRARCRNSRELSVHNTAHRPWEGFATGLAHMRVFVLRADKSTLGATLKSRILAAI